MGTALSGVGQAETQHPAPGVARTVLPGGLRVVTEHVAGARSASVGLWVEVGSRDEPALGAGTHGAAHFLEHLLFKGTRRRSARAIAEEIDAVGGDLNAFTGKEHTCFYAHVLDRDMPLAVDVLGDVVLDAVMAAADVELERDVVLSEIAGRDEDPEDLLADDFDALLFGAHPLGLPVIGTEETVTGMTRDRLADFHDRHYVPARSVLAVAGNVAHADVLAAVTEAYGSRLTGPATSWHRGAQAAPGTPVDRLSVRDEDTEQAHLMLGVPSLARADERWPALQVLSTVLGGGMSSRLFQQVREQRGLAYSVYSSTTGYADTGTLAVYVGCAPERLGAAAAVVRDELGDLAAHGITDAELARAQGQLRGELVLGLEDTSSRMTRLGRRELDHGGLDRATDLATTLERIDAVGARDVASLASSLLAGPRAAAVVGPYGDVDELPGEVQEMIT
ncbi:M16 family metallopeptidase [Actinomycetospora lemnae]|uniref:M16 family metallopeptidase n=1 Tax=Actinomycetospora lemnae TaxID=3019891 RepID=UPI0038CC16A0